MLEISKVDLYSSSAPCVERIRLKVWSAKDKEHKQDRIRIKVWSVKLKGQVHKKGRFRCMLFYTPEYYFGKIGHFEKQHTHTHTRTHARSHARTHTHTHKRTHARTHARTHTHTHTQKSFRTKDSSPTEEATNTGKRV